MTINEEWFRERSGRYPFQCRTDGERKPRPEDIGHSYGEFIRTPVIKRVDGRPISYALWGFETGEARNRFLTKYVGTVQDTL